MARSLLYSVFQKCHYSCPCQGKGRGGDETPTNQNSQKILTTFKNRFKKEQNVANYRDFKGGGYIKLIGFLFKYLQLILCYFIGLVNNPLKTKGSNSALQTFFNGLELHVHVNITCVQMQMGNCFLLD